MQTLQTLFEDMLRDVYYAEKKVLKELPKMIKNATSPALKKTFESHLSETEGQVERLEQVFESIGKTARAKKCEAIEGISAELKELLDEVDDPNVLDAGLIASAQAVEHYEIARYGTLCAWARELGHSKAAALLQKTLDQEHSADSKLTTLASGGINASAEMPRAA